MKEVNEEKLEEVAGGMESEYETVYNCPKCGTIHKMKTKTEGNTIVCGTCGSTVQVVRRKRFFI